MSTYKPEGDPEPAPQNDENDVILYVGEFTETNGVGDMMVLL